MVQYLIIKNITNIYIYIYAQIDRQIDEHLPNRKDLSWLHFGNEPRVHGRPQVKNQHSCISIFVPSLTIPSSKQEHQFRYNNNKNIVNMISMKKRNLNLLTQLTINFLQHIYINRTDLNHLSFDCAMFYNVNSIMGQS